MTRADRILAACVALGALLSAPLAYARHPDASAVTIRGPRGVTSVSSDRPARLAVEGRAGEVIVEIAEGKALAVESSCRDQLCVRGGAASAGRPVVCAPNGVVVSVGGEAEFDAVSR